MCVCPTLLCPTSKNREGTKVEKILVCVFVPPLHFWGVPSNGIKRVVDGFVGAQGEDEAM